MSQVDEMKAILNSIHINRILVLLEPEYLQFRAYDSRSPVIKSAMSSSESSPFRYVPTLRPWRITV
jgi:hypothetical protein